MTEEDVGHLYQALLGRAPEGPDTIAAFIAYYRDVDRGRLALFTSQEFQAAFARLTGRQLEPDANVAASLALALLARATQAAASPLPSVARDAVLLAGMELFFPPGGDPRLAVVVGEAGIALADLLPFGAPQSSILHVAPGFPPAVPLTQALADGTFLFRLAGDAAAIAGVLATLGRPVDAVCLLNRPAGPEWMDALRPHLASRALLVVGRPQEGFDAASLSAAIALRHHSEPVQLWHGLHLHHFGGWLLPVTYEPPATLPSPLDRTAAPSLAIVAIVRNEAVCVQNMLRSARSVASFYAVLDTGSTDATAALARDFLAASGVEFAFAQRDHTLFADDFSAMRNAALAMVPDWVQWVLMLDADEELAAEDAPALLGLIAQATDEAYALPRYNFPGPGKEGLMVAYPDRQIRLLRHTRDGRIAYSGAVHETVRSVPAGLPPLDASVLGGSRGGPHIHHLVRRFRTPEQEEAKQEFYREIARRRAAGA